MGQTPATQSTPNRGSEAGALQKLAVAVKLLGDAFSQAGATSELGQGILKHLSGLAKLVPVGSSSPAGDKNTMDQAQLRNAQQNQQMMAMRQAMMQRAQGGGAPGGAPGMAG
jgi:hypothetical protein